MIVGGRGPVGVGERSGENGLVLPERPDEPGSPASDRPGRQGISALLEDRPYLLLCALLLALMVSHTVKARWGSGIDIWEHAAAARELAEHPLDPQHPLFALDRPHQFLSPYHLVIGLVSRWTGLSVVTVLSWAGVANLMLFLTALWLFVTRLLGKVGTASWALLFILFLWGAQAWYFSGFLHFKVLFLVLSYPATFAKGLALLALWFHLRFLESGDSKLLLVVGAMASVAFLVHPVDAIFVCVGIVALTVGGPTARDRRARMLVLSGITMALSFLAAFLWPYFSLYDLLFGTINEGYRNTMAGEDRSMYAALPERIWPALIILPFVAHRLWTDKRDRLSLFFVGLLLGYAYGWSTQEFSYGRLISSLLFVGALILADERTKAIRATRAFGDPGRTALRWIQITTIALLLVGVVNMRNGFTVLPGRVLQHFPESWGVRQSTIPLVELSQYSFLTRLVEDDDVVLADAYLSLEVAAFGAKAVAVARPESFVDAAQPRADLRRFFEQATSESERRTIMDTHGVAWLLLRNETSEPETSAVLERMGQVAYRNDHFTLVDVRATPTALP